MPSKQRVAQTKDTARPSHTPKLGDGFRQAIKAAADKIPALIAKETYSAEISDTDELLPPPRQKKWLLWSGVGMITIIIFTMWIWNLRSVIAHQPFKQTTEGKIFFAAKDDIRNIISASEVELAIQEAKKQAIAATADAATAASLEESVTALLSAAPTGTIP